MPLPKGKDFKLGHYQNSPQLTTKPEVRFFPQVIGPTTAIDLGPLKKYPEAKDDSEGNG
jgi:hypothetical protein